MFHNEIALSHLYVNPNIEEIFNPKSTNFEYLFFKLLSEEKSPAARESPVSQPCLYI